AGLAWRKGTLYISAATVSGKERKFQLLAWSGWNGSNFTKRKAIYTAPKGFDGFNGLAFGPDGRLYVGVDLGLTDGNDHGPANKHFTKPFKLFPPHTNVMGVGIIGKQLYLSEFQGNGGKSGLIVTMPMKGGTPKTLVTGFVAPVVGLGTHGGWVYFGELTGQV